MARGRLSGLNPSRGTGSKRIHVVTFSEMKPKCRILRAERVIVIVLQFALYPLLQPLERPVCWEE